MIKNAPPMMQSGQPNNAPPPPLPPARSGLVQSLMSQPVRPVQFASYSGPPMSMQPFKQAGDALGKMGLPESPDDQARNMMKAGATGDQALQAVNAGMNDTYAQGNTPPPMGLGAKLGSMVGIQPATTPSMSYPGLPTSLGPGNGGIALPGTGSSGGW